MSAACAVCYCTPFTSFLPSSLHWPLQPLKPLKEGRGTALGLAKRRLIEAVEGAAAVAAG